MNLTIRSSVKKWLIYLSTFLFLTQIILSSEVSLTASDAATDDNFGISVGISGDYAVVGAYLEDEDASGGNTLGAAGSAYIFARSGSNWTQQVKLVASDREGSDCFGYSVSISGDYAAVSAYRESEFLTTSAGAVYIFYRNEGGANNWGQQAKLVASDRATNDYFGYSVSISGDYAVVGAYVEDEDAEGNNTLDGAGSAYIFVRSGTSWSQQAKIVASDRAGSDNFGYSVSISGDYTIVGARWEDEDAAGANLLSSAGSAYIFVRSGSSWSQQQKIVASDRAGYDRFGHSVSISGDDAIVGAVLEDEDAAGANLLSSAGSAYIFIRSGSSWSQQQKIVANDRATNDYFGYSVAISGDYVFVGAELEDDGSTSYDGAAYSFLRNGATWSQTSKVSPSSGSDDYFGVSAAIDGAYAIAGAYKYAHPTRSGGAFIYETAADLSLPVELSSFSAHALRSRVVELVWSTESETENLGFILDRKRVDGDWEEIASYVTHPALQGHGSTTEAHTYSFTDETVVSGEAYDYRLADVSYAGVKEYHRINIVGVEVSTILPSKYELTGAYPNPFNPRTRISYSLPVASEMTLNIYDLQGRLIRTLKSGLEQAGNNHVYWKGHSNVGKQVGSGVYLCQFQSGQHIETLKLVYLK